jgi:hypothetical protein
LGYHSIRSQESDPFDHGLRNQDAVEGIFVYGWQHIDLNCVLAEDREFLIAIVKHRATQNSWVELKSLLSEPTLDCDLP